MINSRVLSSDIDECKSGDKCGKKAVCENRDGGYTCRCAKGYHRDEMTSLCIDIDECEINLDECAKHATCTNTEGSYDCSCNKGFRGDGRTCKGKNNEYFLIN